MSGIALPPHLVLGQHVLSDLAVHGLGSFRTMRSSQAVIVVC